MKRNTSLRSLSSEFAKKYKVQIGRGNITFTLPKSQSVCDLLEDAQRIRLEVSGLVAVYPPRLSAWKTQKHFTAVRSQDKTVSVIPAVSSSNFKTRSEQARLIKSEGLRQAHLTELACAHACFFVVKGRDLFDGKILRCVGGKLYYGDGGLSFMEETDYINACRYKIVFAAAVAS